MEVELVNDGPVTILLRALACGACRLEERFVPRFAAEPPQEQLPYGRWAETLRAEFLAVCLAVDGEEEVGEPGDIVWYPDRTWHGRTFVPATARTSTGPSCSATSFAPAAARRRPTSTRSRTPRPRPPRPTPTGASTSATRSSGYGAARRARSP